MKIAALRANSGGSYWWRIELPLTELVRRGHDVELLRGLDVETWGTGTVLLLQMRFEPAMRLFAYHHRRKGGSVVFEIDDWIHGLPMYNPAREIYYEGSERLEGITAFIRQADALIVSTPALADEYRRLNPNVHVGYNALDAATIERYRALEDPEPNGELRILWAGTITHRDDLLIVTPALLRVLESFPAAVVVFVGADYRELFPSWAQVRMRYAGQTASIHDGKPLEENPIAASISYLELIARQRAHVAIAPFAPNRFNECKSWCKLLDYGALGLPTIASRFGPYAEYVDGASGNPVLLARKENEWVRKLRGLLSDAEMRQRMRVENRAWIEAHHTVDTRADAWERAFSQVVAARAVA